VDNIIPMATGDLSEVIGDFQALPESDFNNAFTCLSPDSYNNSSRTTLGSTQQYIKTIQQRRHSLRASLKNAAAKTVPGYGLWVQGGGQWGDQEGEDGFTGYDYDLYGGPLGVDHFLNDHMLLGISLGISRADIDFENNMGEGGIDAFIGSLYGSWFTGRYYLDASLSYGTQEYDNIRNITFGGIDRTGASDHDGTLFSGYLEGGYNLSLGPWMLGPFATLNYLYLDEDGFTESGAGSLNLIVDDCRTGAVLSQLGAVAAERLTYENFELMPELRLAWKHDFDIDHQIITSAFTGAPGVKFSIEGQKVERNSLLVEVGATLFHTSRLSVPIKYAAEFRNGYTAQRMLCQVRYEY
jgi:subtilase-type serine protease